jgi:hypothetical protein
LEAPTKQWWIEVEGTNQRLVYADDINLLGKNIDTMKKNTEVFQSAVRRLV